MIHAATRRQLIPKSINSLLRSKTARDRKLKSRRYQIDAAIQVAAALNCRRCSVLNLPTGTGKTLIANFVSILRKSEQKDVRGLYIVPRRILADQHKNFASWMYPSLRVLQLDDRRASNPGVLAALSSTADIVISTPELFANCARAGRLADRFIHNLGFIVVDEFDEFLTTSYNVKGPFVRFDVAFEKMRQCLPALPVVLISATSPIEAVERGSTDPVACRLSEFIAEVFDPVRIVVAPKSYARFIPAARIRTVGVEDPEVFRLDAAAKTEMLRSLDRLSFLLRGEPDSDYIFSRLESILSRQVRVIRLQGGSFRSVTMQVLEECFTLRSALTLFDFLYEDMFYGYAAAVQAVKRVRWPDRVEFVERYAFVSVPEKRTFLPQPRQKAREALRIIKSRKGERGVVFTRNIRIAECLASLFSDAGIIVSVVHGELHEDQRREALTTFRSRSKGILILTRDTGRRGLDLPEADYSIFYSPKTNENTVWQEVSRIRSTIKHMKDTYFLFYRASGETVKMQALIAQMRYAGRDYEIFDE